jgi:hypothetical protein
MFLQVWVHHENFPKVKLFQSFFDPMG